VTPTGTWSRPAASSESAGRAGAAAAPAALLLAALAGCAPPPSPPEKPAPVPPALVLVRHAFADLPGWRDDDPAPALAAFGRTCRRLAETDAERRAGWLAACEEATRVAPGREAARAFFERRFEAHLVTDRGRPEGLFTGYFEIELAGSWRRDDRHRFPLYTRPADLVSADLGEFRPEWKGERIEGRVAGGRLLPYPTRSEIEAGWLAGRRLELLWVDDPIDAFFLHVQGSGRVRMPDGSLVRVGFAGRNGRPYFAIGRELVSRGALQPEEVSLQSIRAWLRANPEEAGRVMEKNPSYVFFRVLDGDGPVGAAGATLTPGRSLAVDPAFVPLGAPVFVDTTDPLAPGRPLRLLAVAQDTGSAIKGPVRGDLFFGAGAAAAERAGRMRQRGRYFLLLPRHPPP
jgi:membrane-bound lytic murein transglycosylase A